MRKPKGLLRPKDTIGDRKRAKLFNDLIEFQWKQIEGREVVKIPGIGVCLKSR